MQDIHEQTNSKLAQEILAEVKNASPIFLETLVLHLLKKMGYGKKLETEAGKRVGGVGDGGIDGFVREDQLGFDVIYYQAKRWNSILSLPRRLAHLPAPWIGITVTRESL